MEPNKWSQDQLIRMVKSLQSVDAQSKHKIETSIKLLGSSGEDVFGTGSFHDNIINELMGKKKPKQKLKSETISNDVPLPDISPENHDNNHEKYCSLNLGSQKIISLGQRLKFTQEYIAKKCESEANNLKTISELECMFKDMKQMALIEGYSSHSHIIYTLNDIYNEIVSNCDLSKAVRKLHTLISEVMPFDIEVFFETFSATQKTAEAMRNKVCWVFFGPTGAGKSTCIHFLCGSHFKRTNGGSVIADDINISLKDKNIKIGESVCEAETKHIEAVELDLSNHWLLKTRGNDYKQILLVDTPGFEPFFGPEIDMANSIGIIGALKNAKKVKIIIVFKEAHLDYRFKIIHDMTNNIGKTIINFEEELDKRYGFPIAGMVTKGFHGIDYVRKQFRMVYENLNDSNSNKDALFKALTYKFGNTGCLREIRIDVENFKNNERERLRIIKSLVEETEYITTSHDTLFIVQFVQDIYGFNENKCMTIPNEIIKLIEVFYVEEVFSEFVSELSMSKLKQQIEKDVCTIENILNNDKYFDNPKYINYAIDMLHNMHKLKDIIQNHGMKCIETKLIHCINTFKMKIQNQKQCDNY